MTSHKEPGIGMVLYSEIIPSKGGDTQFADQYGAYNSLPVNLKQRIENLSIKHDRTHTSDGKLRQGFEEVASGDPRDTPGQLHPIVYTHPETGKKALYLGRRAWAYIDGLSLQDSEALLDELWSYAIDDQHVITHQWRVGDVIAWDNRSILHRRDGFNEPRLLKRCQLLNSNQ
jgi:taurine dioxygenase